MQWWNSDRVAVRAMGAWEVSPTDAPELHGMIDRLCVMADMPKPRVAIADTPIPNAFATADRRPVVGVRDDRPPADAGREELEGVLAHELSHVAHRDVLVMTVASTPASWPAWRARGAQYGFNLRRGGNDRRDDTTTAAAFIGLLIALVASLVTYAISFPAHRTLLSRYRECAPTAPAST